MQTRSGHVVVEMQVIGIGARARGRGDEWCRPIYYGTGIVDYVCGTCNSLLAEGMSPGQLLGVPVRCPICGSANAVRGLTH